MLEYLFADSEQHRMMLSLGKYLNYSHYEKDLEDLFFLSDELYLRVSSYSDPFDLVLSDCALCRLSLAGGGRKAVSGINHLPEADIKRLIDEPKATFDTGYDRSNNGK